MKRVLLYGADGETPIAVSEPPAEVTHRLLIEVFGWLVGACRPPQSEGEVQAQLNRIAKIVGVDEIRKHYPGLEIARREAVGPQLAPEAASTGPGPRPVPPPPNGRPAEPN